MGKLQIGSVYKTTGSRECFGLQFIGHSNIIGDIARVCQIDENVSEFCDKIKTIFVIGFPFSPAIKDGYLKYMINCPVPDDLENLKFRFPNVIPGGDVAGWTIISDEGQQIVSFLEQEQLNYPLAYAVNIQKLEELVALKWNGREILT